jgi:hypothetical protein
VASNSPLKSYRWRTADLLFRLSSLGPRPRWNCRLQKAERPWFVDKLRNLAWRKGLSAALATANSDFTSKGELWIRK